MAYRRHILAVRNTTREALAQALANASVSDVIEDSGWCWTMASVWTTSARDLLDALSHVEGPVLLATTEDGSRWWLHLMRKGLERFSTFHEFTMLGEYVGGDDDSSDWEDIYGSLDEEDDDDVQVIQLGAPPLPVQRLEPLDFEDDFFEFYSDDDEEDDDEDDDAYEDDEGDDSPAGALLGYYEDAGVPLPDALVEALVSVPVEERRSQFLTLHSAYIADALLAYGVPHNRAEVLPILTGENVTAAELESDVGNLWRFLVHLGLGNEFETALQELELTAEEVPYDPAAEIRNSVAKLELHPLERGPAFIPIEKGPLLCRIASALDTFADFLFEVGTDATATDWPTERIPAYTKLLPVPGGVALTFDGPNVVFARQARQRVGQLLAELPDGVTLELAASCEKQSYRLRGSISSGSWCIEQASVLLSAEEVTELVDLFENAEACLSQQAIDEAEAEAIMAGATTDVTLYNALPIREGLSLAATSGEGASALAGLIFRRRFRHRWDVRAIQAQMEENYRNWAKIESDMEEQSVLPTNGKVVYAGTASRFLEPDYAAASVDEMLREKVTNTDSLDDAFAGMGFSHLGVLVCERLGGGFLRCYANGAECTYAVAYFLPFGQYWHDFVSLMDDGTVFTTTSSSLETSIRSLRILIRLSRDAGLAAMHGDHQEGLSRLEQRGMSPVAIDASLEGIARTMDDFLVRRIGAEGEDDE